MNVKITELARILKQKTIERRRDFHKYAETAWTEFRTAAIVADTLTQLGYEVLSGDEVIDITAMMGVPDLNELDEHAERALAQGANPDWIKTFKGGKTGVVGILRFAKPGPTVALRFDMDANDIAESEEEEHRPYREQFSSINKGAMHACGHDGHTAVGLTIAEIFSQIAENLSGTLKLIFQPAEEGVRGAKAMVAKNVVDDVDYLIGMHLGTDLQKIGQVAYQADGFMATTKVDANFTGIAAHAGAVPETGNNTLLAAANAVLNLHAISRHSEGNSRINVGVMNGGTGRNIVPANAIIKFETRAENSRVNEYMYQEAVRIIEAAAAMYKVQVSMKLMGGCAAGKNDPELAIRVKHIAEQLNLFTEVMAVHTSGGSEDCTYLMERVQQRGGQAVYTIIGTELSAGHHNFKFDFNEDALELAVIFLTSTVVDILS